MATEKEKIVSEQNYEISKSIYNLFKKYRNYELNVKSNPVVKEYNPEDLFKNKREVEKQEVALVEVKEQKWYEKIFSFLREFFRKK